MPQPKDPARRLNYLRGAGPQQTVRNLAEQLERSIETSARLRLFSVEANQEGLEDTAQTYERLDQLERRQILELELQLRRQLDAALAEAQPDEELGQ
jgi:hypothetical protein